MTKEKFALELSDKFDVLYNNVTSNQAPGLNEYEKSVFLTKAQEEIIKNYFNPKANPKQDGFDDSPKRQADFATLVNHVSPSSAGNGTFDIRAKAYYLPSDMFLCLNEQFTDNGTPLTVVPISYEEYDRLMAKPYKYPPKYQVWRLITKNTVGGHTYTETIPGVGTYAVQDDGDTIFTFRMETNSTIPVSLAISKATQASPNGGINVASGSSSVSISIVVPWSYLTSAGGFASYWSVIQNNSEIWDYLSSLNWPTNGEIDTHPTADMSDVGLSATATTRTVTEDVTATVAEFIGRFASGSPTYRIRYVKRPNPIILANFDSSASSQNSLSLYGKSTIQEFSLPEELYDEVLQRAVELAKVAWTANGQENVQLVMQAGQRSE